MHEGAVSLQRAHNGPNTYLEVFSIEGTQGGEHYHHQHHSSSSSTASSATLKGGGAALLAALCGQSPNIWSRHMLRAEIEGWDSAWRVVGVGRGECAK